MKILRGYLGEWQVLPYLFVIFLLLQNSISISISVQQSSEVFIYCSSESSTLETLLRYSKNKPDWKATYYYLNDSSSYKRFFEILNTLYISGIEILPLGYCTSCELVEHFSWDNVLIAHASPIIGFFRNGRLGSIIFGVINYDILDQCLVVKNEDYVKILTDHGSYNLSDYSIIARLEELFLGLEKSERAVDLTSPVSSIVLLALADSINPCTFAVFSALLLITLNSLGKMKTALTGFSFILAIFIGYYSLGLGFVQILPGIPNISKITSVAGLALGAYNILHGLRPRFKSPIPKSFRKFIASMLNKHYVSPAASFFLGLIASFTLLPCSSGPYLVGLGLLSVLEDRIQVFSLLSLYNTIFVIPLILILIGVLTFTSLSGKIKDFRSTKLKFMEIISGALLVAVCMWILLS